MNLLGKILQYSNEIKNYLKISEKEFFESRLEDSEKALYFWIYSVIDDIYKISMKIISEQEIIESKDDKYINKNEDNLKGLDFERFLFEHISIEINFWQRKIIEHFLNMILLNNIDNKNDLEKISKIYFLGLRINDTLTNQNIYKVYYDFEHSSSVIEREILLDKINILVSEVGKPYFFKNLNFNKPGQIFKSTSELYKESLKFCSEKERVILGLNYSLYHSLSKGIHGNGHYRNNNINLNSCIKKYNHLILLSFITLSTIFDLLKIEKDDFLLNLNFLDSESKIKFTQNYNLGDLIIFMGDLYEIKDIKKSIYGYYSYLIYRELGDLENEKWVPKEGLILALNENNFEDIIKQIDFKFNEEELKLFNKLSKKEQFLSLKYIILDLNKSGINIFIN